MLRCLDPALWILEAIGPHTPGFLTRHFSLCGVSPTQALSQFCPSPPATPTLKVLKVLTAAEGGSCSPEQWKNKLLKGLFPRSEYFYKANAQDLSPHTQLFLTFLTRSSG